MSLERDSTLSATQRFALRFHTLLCTGCRNYRQQMAFLHTASVERASGAISDGQKDDA
jgi:hypothetical protein